MTDSTQSPGFSEAMKEVEELRRMHGAVAQMRGGIGASADKLLQRLDGVITRGPGRWSARCPAHDDKTPSLGVAEAGDSLLIHCFAGCAAEDVLTAVGLTFADLYPDRWKAAYKGATANAGRKFADRLLRDNDPLDLERWVLRIAARDLRNGRELSLEDRARIEIARARLGVEA